jgi:hypothetical protein
MKPEKDNGGPAFPLQDWDEVIHSRRMETGMSLRDYFAAAALQGLCDAFAAQSSDTWPDDRTPEDYDVAAKHSYGLADAMLAARKGAA